MESPRELCHSIPKVCQEHGLLWRAQGSSAIQFNSKGVPGARPSMESPRGRSTIQFNSKGVPGARPSMESPRGISAIQFNSKGVPGARPSIESPIGSSTIQFKRCARSTAFYQFKRCVRSTAFYGEPKRELCHSIQKVCQEHGLPS